MKKSGWALVALMAIIAVFILTIGVYKLASVQADLYGRTNNTTTTGVNVTATPAVIPGKDDGLNFSLEANTPGTALSTFAAVVNQSEITGWTESMSNVSVVSISADSCLNGASDMWKITLAGDYEYATFYAREGIVQYVVDWPGTKKDNTPQSSDALGDASNEQALNLSLVIDSDEAWDIANLTFLTEPDTAPSVAMMLKVAGNRSYWDLYDTTGDGIRIVRIDAMTGELVKTASIGG